MRRLSRPLDSAPQYLVQPFGRVEVVEFSTMEAATVVPRISRLGLRPFADFERKFPTAPRLSNSPLPTLVPANRVLFWQDDHQRQEIRVVRGVVRAVRLLENGTRQILAFYWPGEVIPSA